LEEEFKRVDCPWNKIDSQASEAQVKAFAVWNSHLLGYYHLVKGLLRKVYKFSERVIQIAPSVTYPENFLSTLSEAKSFEEQDSGHLSTNPSTILLEFQGNVRLNPEGLKILEKTCAGDPWDIFLFQRLLEWFLNHSKFCRLVYNRWQLSDLVARTISRLQNHPMEAIFEELETETNQRYADKTKETMKVLTKLLCTLQMEIGRGKGRLLDDYRSLVTKVFAAFGDQSLVASQFYVQKNPVEENLSHARTISRASIVGESRKEELSRERLSTKAEIDPDISLSVMKGFSSRERRKEPVSSR
jgi:hypothetical protein